MPIGGTLSDLGGHFDPIAESARRASEQVRELSGDVQRISTQVRNNSQNIQQVIEMLNTSMNGIVSEVRGVTTSIQGLSSALRPAREGIEQQAKTMEDAYKVYREMGLEVRKLGLDLESLKFTESELNKVIKIGTDFTTQGNAKRASSYDALSQRYRAMKILYDNMTESERQNNSEFVAGLRDLYEKMNLLQQATGKYQLQVGNYSKAMTGLNIATQQVLRELPTLANSATTFAIAISNNIPILVDNILAVKKANAASISYKNALLEQAAAAEAAGDATLAMKLKTEAASVATTTVLKGLISSIFSWQTLIIGVLTILPMFLRKLEQKKKAMKENAEATKEEAKATETAIKKYKEFYQILGDIESSAKPSTTEVDFLNKVLADNNRSVEERISAGKRLKQIFDEELEGYSAEEIAIGKAAKDIAQLTNYIYEQAKARANLNQITELTQRYIELETRAKLYETFKYGERSVKDYSDALDEANKKQENIFMAASIRESVDTYRGIIGEMKNIQAQIDNLGILVDPMYLLEEETPKRRSRRAKETSVKMKDYFVEFYEGILEQIEGDRSREELLAMFEFDTQIDKYKKYLAEQRALSAEEREIDITQEKYIEGIILNLEAQKYIKLAEIDEKWTKKINDANLKQQKTFEREQEQAFKDELAYAQLILDTENNLDREKYENNVLYRRAAIDNEIEYWGNYLDTIIKYGKWTQEEEDNVLANIARLREQKSRVLPKSLWDVLGMLTNEEIPREYRQTIEQAFDYTFKYMDTWMDKRLEMAEIELEAAKRQADIVKTYLDIEQEARANGYANNVEMARRAYEKQLELQRKAAAEAERIARIQNALNTATQASELLTATAKIWSAEGIKGILGVPLATAATASMWASFIASKAMASKVTAKTYGEGGYEYMNYGGSHASGHDIDFGRTRDGRARRVERGEMVGIINKRNVAKYGVGTIGGIIDSINNGTFEMADKYSLAFQGSNLATLENGVNALVEQGKEKVVATPWGRIEYSGNVKRIIKN